MYLFGESVRGGQHGVRPSLTDLDANGNLRHFVDFRSVYSTVLADWLDVDPAAVIEGAWPRLELLA